jgi:hypothetical protein
MEKVREVRDSIREKVREFVEKTRAEAAGREWVGE